MKASQCPSCGAPIPPETVQCPYCGQFFQRPSTMAPQPGTPAQPASSSGGIVFRRRADPSEGAFHISVPEGWIMEGGIQRSDHMHQVVSAQSIEPKVDFVVKRDAEGAVLIRWCPEMKYADVSMTPAGMMGLFPPGSNYQGMIVSPVVPAVAFLTQMVFPWAHPEAGGARVVEQVPLPDLVEMHQKRQAATGLPWQFQFDAAQVTFEYVEQGRTYRERARAVIENRGQPFAGAWSNKETILWRAPAEEMEQWEPVLRHIRESVELNPEWLAREQVSQQMLMQSFQNAQRADIARAKARMDTQHYIQQVAQEIAEHRDRTQAEIRNDMYLTMTNQEEYINPYTSKVDIASNQWKHRWVSETGDELYTDDEWFDPNVPPDLGRQEWKRTPIRPRFPG